MVNSSVLITPSSRPTLRITSSVRPRVFISQPIAWASRSGMPLALATAQVPTNLPPTATVNTRAAAPQRAGVLRLPIWVLRPLMAKNSGNKSCKTTASRRNSRRRRRGS